MDEKQSVKIFTRMNQQKCDVFVEICLKLEETLKFETIFAKKEMYGQHATTASKPYISLLTLF